MATHPLLDAFYRDGSLRDVVVDASRADLDTYAARLLDHGWTLQIRDRVVTLEEVRRWTPPEGVVECIHAGKGGCDLHLWSWSPAFEDWFSEVDLDPRQIDGTTLETVLEALQLLAETIGRDVHVSPENTEDVHLATVSVDGRVRVHVP